MRREKASVFRGKRGTAFANSKLTWKRSASECPLYLCYFCGFAISSVNMKLSLIQILFVQRVKTGCLFSMGFFFHQILWKPFSRLPNKIIHSCVGFWLQREAEFSKFACRLGLFLPQSLTASVSHFFLLQVEIYNLKTLPQSDTCQMQLLRRRP